MNEKVTVYVPQEPMRKNAEQRWVSKGLDIASISEYGRMVIVWPPDASVFSGVSREDALRIAEAYDEEQDYIVSLGSPSLIGLLAWAIGTAGKRLRILEWDRSMHKYYPTLGESTNGNR